VKRIDVHYDGVMYTVPDGDVDQLKAAVLAVVTGGGEPFWLEANLGSGSYRRVDLLIAPGVSISLSATPTGADLDGSVGPQA